MQNNTIASRRGGGKQSLRLFYVFLSCATTSGSIPHPGHVFLFYTLEHGITIQPRIRTLYSDAELAKI
jgi:hypothetical protein